MTTTDRAAAIRKALKAKGWSSRKVSVRADYYSMGSSINVSIKDPDVPLDAVKKIAEGHESISRCEMSGEILSGGNRFVHVAYDYSTAEKEIKARYSGILGVAGLIVDLNRNTPNSNVLEPIADTGYLMGTGNGGHGYSLWKSDAGHIRTAYEAVDLALALHVGLLS